MSKSKPLTELRDAEIHRVDAVKGAANGTRFLIAKAAAPGIVSAEEVRDLIAEPAGDQYLGEVGEVIKSEEPSKTEQIRKEQVVTTTADTTPAAVAGTNPLKAARAVLKQAKLAKTAKRLQKRALIARAVEATPLRKGTLGNLADAHVAVLEALKGQEDPDTAKKLQGLADDIAGAMSDHAMSESGTDEMAEPEDGTESEAEVMKAKPVSKPVTLKKAKAAAKAARLEKRAARDRISVAKAQATLAKIGRRNSTTDQGHVDAIDDHAAALGASAHQAPPTGTPAILEKGIDDRVAGAIEIIKDAIGPLFGEKLEAIRGDLTQMSGQLATIAKTSLPGGPRVVLERDGSLVAAPDGQPGLTFEQVALGKAAERYPVGSVQREVLEKAAATSAIKDLMEARDNR